MRFLALALCVATTLLSGCTTRSISDSGYPPERFYGSRPSNPLYQGELSEFDVIGVDAGATPAEEEIRVALSSSADRISLRKGDSIMLIQSGAMIPDAGMLQHMEQTFSVSVFSGVPEKHKTSNAGYSRSLRLAAAKAGIATIVVYWGVLESGIENLGTKTVSWIPIVGSILPDEAQTMRIRLKIGVIDVRTGRWEMFTPRALDERRSSARIIREQSDQTQVHALKEAAYSLAAEAFLARYVR
ncbi:MAG: hypothetical protein MUE46_14840 [Xanthomonadales bacterium]|jgi:hypothetical protein|nr:hypothetical protein [Xanthomonadales bacterium]